MSMDNPATCVQREQFWQGLTCKGDPRQFYTVAPLLDHIIIAVHAQVWLALQCYSICLVVSTWQCPFPILAMSPNLMYS